MKGRLAASGVLAASLCVSALPRGALAQRDVATLSAGWKFTLDEQNGAHLSEFDDSGWHAVRLPHDWAIAGPFNPEERGNSGKLPWKGIGWYRRSFSLDQADAGRRIYLDFDGVMAFPKVYVNGQLAGQWDYGYMSFRVDATPYVRFGQDNVIAVQADTRNHGTRWYPGAGIYRKVTMTIAQPIHIAHWGTFVTTPKVNEDSATVNVHSTIENHLDADTVLSVGVAILAPDGKPVVSASQTGAAPAHGEFESNQSLVVPNPRRWDVDRPSLYVVRTTIESDGRVVDSEETTFGIRTFEFTADDGFLLNGRRVQLRGVNLHHDHGPLGAAFSTRAMERQLEIMQDMGVNAIRTSHNPSAPELLDLADRMGLFVWDECFDKWNTTADLLDREQVSIIEHADKQLTNLVKRDRNHPSVFVWSIGNEIGNSPDHEGDGKSFDRLNSMRDSVRRNDDTRPVAMGCHIPGTVDQAIFDPLDLTGWNYGRRYARMREVYPDKPILYSESASTVSTRGYYSLPLPNAKTEYPGGESQVSSYDLSATSWSDVLDLEFDLLERDRFIGGEFVWTGFDYLGEPTPFSQAARSSYFGCVDLVGIPKDRFYLYRSTWRPDTTTIHIVPHWNWPDRVGRNVPVFVYTNGDSAELFLNGQSLGRRTKGEVPDRPANLALGRPATASSALAGSAPEQGNDANEQTEWTAAEAGPGQWWQVDLGKVGPVRFLVIDVPAGAANSGYRIDVSDDGDVWNTVVTKTPDQGRSRFRRRRGPSTHYHSLDAQARYVQMQFTELQGDGSVGIIDFGIYLDRYESEYYDATYTYRLRWNDVIYEPGELKVVAYKGGSLIGEATMRTAGKPAAIRLTPDRTTLFADGDDLSYVLVEAFDENGTLCALADDMIHFAIDGPAEIAGVGNGNPMSIEPFQSDHRKLFYGKAMLILRTIDGQGGGIRVAATAEGLRPATVDLRSSR